MSSTGCSYNILMKPELSGQILKKNTQISNLMKKQIPRKSKFHEIHRVGAELSHAEGRTDGQTDGQT